MDTPSQTLPCKECGYVNEPERVYCHSCGQKLDRSLLPKDEPGQRESVEKARRRIKRMTNPETGNLVKREVWTLGRTLLWAAVLAALIQVVRAPAGLPSGRELADKIVGDELLRASESAQPVAINLSEADINSFFRNSVKAKDSGWIPGINFKRAFVKLDPGVVRIGVERTVWGYSLFSSTAYRLEMKDGAFAATNVGGSFGRLPVHPLIMQGGDYFFRKLWTALKPQHDVVQRAQAVQVDQGRISLQIRGGAAPAR